MRTVHEVVRRGLDKGLRLETQMRSAWDISGGCQSPVPFEMNGLPRRLEGGRHVRAKGLPHSLLLTVRCRKCAWCLGRRRNLWAFRGQVEIASAPRTWFGTLTMGPTEHALMRYRASSRLWRGGTDIELLSAREQFEELCKEFGVEVTLWLKRIRKKLKGKLRYLLVFERHKSGLPHAHILVHDIDESNPVRHAALTAEWKLGFTKFKLCEAIGETAKAAWYVAKYLSKSCESRVRASLRYGQVQPCSNIAADDNIWPRVSPPATPSPPKGENGGITPAVLRKKENDYETLSQAGLLSKPANLAAEGSASASASQIPSSALGEAEPSASAPSRAASATSTAGGVRHPPQAVIAFIAKFASAGLAEEASYSMGPHRRVRVRLVPAK